MGKILKKRLKARARVLLHVLQHPHYFAVKVVQWHLYLSISRTRLDNFLDKVLKLVDLIWYCQEVQGYVVGT